MKPNFSLLWILSVTIAFLLAHSAGAAGGTKRIRSTATYSNISAIYTSGFSGGTTDPATQLSVYVKLVKDQPDAIAYCGAFKTTTSTLILVPLSSNSDILRQGFYAYSSEGIAHIIITGLIPASTYDIYCLTVSEQDNSVVMPYRVTLLKSSLASTQCCKTTTFTTAISSLLTGTSTAAISGTALSLALSAYPTNNMTVTLALYNKRTGATDAASVGTLTPSVVDFWPTYISNTPIAVVYQAGDPGTYGINVTMTGHSEVEYLLELQGVPQITVLAADAEPAAPKMKTAVFSSDGTYVTVEFDSPTNQGGVQNTFPCDYILYFDGMVTATCTWSDNRHILIYPQYAAGQPVLGVKSTIAIYPEAVQALCTNAATGCHDWVRYTASTSVRVKAPTGTNAITTPTVIIGAHSSVGPCSPITLDFTSSIGAAGRPWNKTTITVADAAANGNLSYVSALLASNGYRLSPPTPIPAAYLTAGHVYTFTAVFCNFLGACGTASKAVGVSSVATTPVVTIAGLTTRTVNSWTPLLVTANAFTQSCSGSGGQSTANLQYSWILYKTGAVDLPLTGIPSVSQNPAAFKLNPYSLVVGSTYRAQVSVKSTAAGAATSAAVTASVFIVVAPSALVAVITSGSSRSVQASVDYTVDASGSYDQDVPGRHYLFSAPMSLIYAVASAASLAALSFTFACWQTAPTYSATCPVNLTQADPDTPSQRVVSSTSADVGRTVRITVSVFDATRTASTYTDLTFTAAPASVLTVSSSLASLTSVNVNQQIVLTGSLSLVAPCRAVWSVSDASISLAAVVPTPVTSDLTSLSPAANTFPLLIPGGTLPQRAALSFTLTCGSIAASLALTTNGSPLPGAFRISPRSGVELTTSFTFAASLWTDPDLPLAYQFGFVSPSSGALLVLQGKSESSYTAAFLPAGAAGASKNVVMGTLQVYDVLGAAASVQTNATVTPLGAGSSEQTSGLQTLIGSSSGSVDATNAVIATAGSVLNAVNCTGSANCAALHRAECSAVAHTCGTCLLGYFGVAGHQNSACMTLEQFTNNGNRRHRRLTVGAYCHSDANCNTGNWEFCSTTEGRCVQQSKSCPGACSDRGVCGFYALSTGAAQTSCGVGDTACAARCECSTGYGGAACQYTTAELTTRMAFRAALITSLENVTRVDDINEVSLSRWANALSSLTQNSDELSTDDAAVVHRIANLTLAYAAQLGSTDHTALLGLLASLDAATSVLAAEARRRRLAGERRSLAVAAAHSDILSTAGAFGDLIAGAMVKDQAGVQYVYTNFRLSSQVSSQSSSGEGVGIAGPQSDLEYYSGAQAPFVNLGPSTSGSGTIASTVVVADAASFAAIADALVSNPLQLRVDSPESLKTVTFTMVNNVPNPKFVTGARSQNFTLFCTTEVRSQTYTCADSGAVLTQHCTGVAGVHITYCPVPTPQCSLLDGASLSLSTASGCRVVDDPIQAGITTCECDLSITNRRRLAGTTFNDVLSETGVASMVTTSSYIASSFAATFHASTDFTTPAAAQKVLIVILLFALLWAVGLLSLVGLCFRRKKVISNQESRRTNKVGSAGHTTTDVRKYLLAYVDKLIPDVYQSTRSKLQRAADETRKHHRYLQLFTARDDQIDVNKRILTLTKMLTVQTMLMFLLAVLYDLQGPDDDGSCVRHVTKSSCLRRESILDPSQKYCQWGIEHHVGYDTCTYAPPQFSAKIMIYIIVLTSIFTALLNTPIDRLFDTLEAPTGDMVGESRLVKASRVAVAGARRMSAAAVSGANAVVTATASRLGRVSFAGGRLSLRPAEETALASRRIPEDVNFAHTLAYMALPEISAQAQMTSQRQSVVNNEIRTVAAKRITAIRKTDVNSRMKLPVGDDVRPAELVGEKRLAVTSDDLVDQLLEEIMQQRLILPTHSPETIAYDQQWGIEVVSAPNADGSKGSSTSLYINGYALRGMSKDVTASDERARELRKRMENHSDAQVGLDILHLFMVDLLGRHTLAAKIFENKFEEDFERTQVVSKYTKWAVMLCIVALNAFFMYYSLLKGYAKGVHWQNQYLQGCITQLLIEIFLFESMECVWINYWVPDLVSGEVMRAGVILREATEKISLADRDLHTDHETEIARAKLFLDAPSYLFVSTKLAKKFPNLLESIIVSGYRSHLPGEIARTWKVNPQLSGSGSAGARGEQKSVWAAMRGQRTFGAFVFAAVVGLSSGLAVAMQAMGALPYFYQRIIIRFVQPVLLSGLTILWYFAIRNPVYTAIIVCACVLVLFVLYIRYANRSKNNRSAAKVAPHNPFSASSSAGSSTPEEYYDGPTSPPHLSAVAPVRSRGVAPVGGVGTAAAAAAAVTDKGRVKRPGQVGVGAAELESKYNEGKFGEGGSGKEDYKR